MINVKKKLSGIVFQKKTASRKNNDNGIYSYIQTEKKMFKKEMYAFTLL